MSEEKLFEFKYKCNLKTVDALNFNEVVEAKLHQFFSDDELKHVRYERPFMQKPVLVLDNEITVDGITNVATFGDYIVRVEGFVNTNDRDKKRRPYIPKYMIVNKTIFNVLFNWRT